MAQWTEVAVLVSGFRKASWQRSVSIIKVVVVALPLGLVGGLIWASPSFNSPRQIEQAAYDGISVDQVERTAYRDTDRDFDDHYQRYIGVLDVLRVYPEP